MKKFFSLISLFLSLSCSAQKELFGYNNGLSFSYLRMIYEDKEPDFALGMSALVNKSIAINAGFINIDGYC